LGRVLSAVEHVPAADAVVSVARRPRAAPQQGLPGGHGRALHRAPGRVGGDLLEDRRLRLVTSVTPPISAGPAGCRIIGGHPRKGSCMAAMKPRTGDGPMEAVKEGRLIIVRVPLEGGGRLVVSVNDAEAKELYDALAGVVAAAS